MTQQMYQIINNELSEGKKTVIARIISRSGSTPRDVGSMCVVTEDNRLIGTVGGGLLEYKVHKKAAAMLKENKKSYIYRFTLSNDDLAKNGMICGGETDLFLEVLSPSNKDTVNIFKTLETQLSDNRPVTLITRVENDLDPMGKELRLLIQDDGQQVGALPGFAPDDLNKTQDLPFQLIGPGTADPRFFVERLMQRPRIFLFGAGHVSTCVAPLARQVGFDITVIDDRPEFANKERFPDAESVIVSEFKQAFDSLDISENAYILIITRGHLHDKSVLEMSLQTPAKYIGMIGSIKKRNTIYQDLISQGISKQRLEEVYSPIGIEINAQTPEEIAVSIVAELIQKRAPKKEKKNLIL